MRPSILCYVVTAHLAARLRRRTVGYQLPPAVFSSVAQRSSARCAGRGSAARQRRAAFVCISRAVCALFSDCVPPRRSAARRSAPAARLSSSAFGVYSLGSATLARLLIGRLLIARGASSVGSSSGGSHRSTVRFLISRLLIGQLLNACGSSSVVPHRSALIVDSSSLGSTPSSPRSGFCPRLNLLLVRLLLPLGSSVLSAP